MRESHAGRQESRHRNMVESEDDNHGEGPSRPYGVREASMASGTGWPEERSLRAGKHIALHVPPGAHIFIWTTIEPSDEEMDC